jgi:hypothetical protein
LGPRGLFANPWQVLEVAARRPASPAWRAPIFDKTFVDEMNAFKSIIKLPDLASSLGDVQMFIIQGARKYFNNILQRNRFTLK